MKGVASVLISAAITCHAAAQVQGGGASPAAQVVTLLANLKGNIEASGASEQTSYNAFACWCENTAQEKATAITNTKTDLEGLQNAMVTNKGQLGKLSAQVKQLSKEIAENLASQKEATEVREKEYASYAAERAESEQSIAALEGAIKALTGAGEGKAAGFLETHQEAKLLGVAASMRPVLKDVLSKSSLSDENMEVVERFVAKPVEFVKGAMFSQTGQNPAGDYAPASTQIQGILKSMYDSFTSDLEKDNAKEAQRQKEFGEFQVTKNTELATAQGDLSTAKQDQASQTTSLTQNKASSDTKKKSLAADEEFWSQTKDSCAAKAKGWAEKSRSRTTEINGIDEAIKILNSTDAKANFATSESKSFLQLSMVNSGFVARRARAYEKLSSVAARYHSVEFAQIAATVKHTRGHFDSVVAMIGKMLATTRQEEQDDIAHKDRCETKENANQNAIADALRDKTKHNTGINRMETAILATNALITKTEQSIVDNELMQNRTKNERANQSAEYKVSLKADTATVKLFEQAQASLEKFYKDTSALQVGAAPMPATNFKGGESKGHSGEARGVLVILEMLKEDVRKQIKSEGQEELDAQKAYEDSATTLVRNQRALEKALADAKAQLADQRSKKVKETSARDKAQTELDSENQIKTVIATDCNWVATHFASRRDKRKAEMDGLSSASEFLAAAGAPIA